MKLTLREIINQVMDANALKQVFNVIYEKYYTDTDENPKHDIETVANGYTSTVRELLELDSTSSAYAIALTEGEEWMDVHLVADGKKFAMDFVLWEELVDSTIVDNTGRLENTEALAHILWEMTFYGFTEARVKEAGDELLEASKGPFTEFKLEDLED
jgi:hypothetical protein